MELKLLTLLKGVNSIAIDTAPFIYYIEEHKVKSKDLAVNNDRKMPDQNFLSSSKRRYAWKKAKSRRSRDTLV